MRNSERNAHSSRRGFTVLEVVIALTVITIVSASAFALIHSHIKLEQQSIQSIEATNIAENAIECFRFANGDSGGFKDAYETAVSTDDSPVVLDGGAQDDGSTKYTYTDSALNVTFTIIGNKFTVEGGNAYAE